MALFNHDTTHGGHALFNLRAVPENDASHSFGYNASHSP